MKFLQLLFIVLFFSCTKTDISQEEQYINQKSVERTSFTISGKVLWATNNSLGVRNTTVILTGSENQTVLTDSLGNYLFTVSTDGNYSISAEKQINRLNGVTTADVSRIQQHLLNNLPITDPYKLVAADINHNNVVNAQDATYLLQSIIGNPTALNIFNKYWRFTPNFSLTLPPWGFSESINLINVSSDQTDKNFLGIKVGDVNGSANPQL